MIAARHVTVSGGRTVVVRSAVPGDGLRLAAIEADQIATDPNRVRDPDEDIRGPERFEELIAERTAAPHGLFVVARQLDHTGTEIGDIVGRVVLWPSERWRKCAHHAVFGIGVHSAWRGCGLGTALLTAMLDWATQQPNLEKVRLSVLATNTGARRLYRRLGFRTEGRLRRHFKMRDGRIVDDLLMAIWVKPIAPEGFQAWSPSSTHPPHKQ
jgi:RimJ/RimL family protein N-acetyltransferase